MKKVYNQIIVILLALVFVSSCSDDKLNDSIINIPEGPKSELDQWIRNEFTTPHNLELIYKWVDPETDVGKNLVPPELPLVKPFLEILKEVWVDVYIEVAGKDFFNRLTPKQVQLIGSHSYNSDGTITQGTAEAGVKIVLYGINYFSTENVPAFLRFFHVIHHEFAHITHQTKMFDENIYGNITPSGYRSDWMNISENDAPNHGFISSYSMLSPTEDFVEVVAVMLTTTPEEFQGKINNATEPGKSKLKEKVDFVVNYYKTEWNIDLYYFQEVMSEVIAKVLKDNSPKDDSL